jgi:hypothetical protein
MAIAFVGCAKDKNADQIKNQQFQEELAKLKAADGDYTGLLVSRQGKKVLGAMRLRMAAGSKVVDTPTDQNGGTAHPYIATTIELLGQVHLTMQANSSYLDPERGHFQADKQIANSTETISLIADLAGPGVIGTLQDSNYPDYAADFVLTKGGKDITELKPTDGVVDEPVFTRMSFQGTTKFAGGVTKPVNIVFEKPQTTSDQGFLTLLVPVKPILITFNYGESALVQYVNGSWDQQANLITGQSTITRTSPGAIASPGGAAIGNQTFQLSINCSQDLQTMALGCKHAVSSSLDKDAAQTKAKLVTGDLKEIPEIPGSIQALSQVFRGTGSFDGGKTAESVEFTVMHPLMSRLDEVLDLYYPNKEMYIGVTFAILPSRQAGQAFSGVKWDLTKNALQTSDSVTLNSHPLNRILNCQNFAFSKKYNFTCQFMSSLNNLLVPMTFKSN